MVTRLANPGGRPGAVAECALAVCAIGTPLGVMAATASERGVCGLDFVDDREVVETDEGNEHLASMREEVAAYFAGTLRVFRTPLDLRGTEFQVRVWRALLEIPFGVTRSYLHVARSLGSAEAVRAVARANGANRVAIVVPCHRVIGSDGSLTGYAAGVERKEWLLRHEGCRLV